MCRISRRRCSGLGHRRNDRRVGAEATTVFTRLARSSLSSMKPPSTFGPVLPGWTLAFCLGVAAAVFLPTLGGGFIADDFVYVARFAAFPWGDWPRLFTQEWSEGIWGFPLSELRPFSALSFMLDARLYGGEAAGYRITNLLLHLEVVTAVVRLTWRMSEGHTLATLTAGLAFALHPAHVEPVGWITGRVDLLSTLGAMAFWVLAESWSATGRPWRAVVALTCLGIGLFAKELSLFAPPLLLLRWLLVDARGGRTIWQRRLLLLLGVAIVALAYTLCRRAAFGDGAAQPVSSWDQAAAWQRQVSYLAWLAPVLPFLDQFEWKAVPPLAVLRGFGLGASVRRSLSWWWLGGRTTLGETSCSSPPEVVVGDRGRIVAGRILLGAALVGLFPTAGPAVGPGLGVGASDRAWAPRWPAPDRFGSELVTSWRCAHGWRMDVCPAPWSNESARTSLICRRNQSSWSTCRRSGTGSGSGSGPLRRRSVRLSYPHRLHRSVSSAGAESISGLNSGRRKFIR